ncbi:MAG: DUF882 domain-containing protein [Deltaproteobacteria bacterium]|nr:DUF882 domain-containing protein [Deltaproteobacteria bacterium]
MASPPAQIVKEIDPVRRRFIKMTIFSGLAALVPFRALALIPDFTPNERSIRLYNPVTNETVSTTYWIDGKYVPKALDGIDYIMRDHRTGEVKSIDLGLVNLLHSLKVQLGLDEPFHVVSGYRCPKSNEMLRRSGKRAARNSYHLKGQAADIRLPDVRLDKLRQAATAINGGGVGYYPRDNFIHIDVGPVRYWSPKPRKNAG